MSIMNIKTYLKQNKLKISDISKQTGIPYTTVSEIINGKTDIDKVQIGIGLKIADACKMDFKRFYNTCKKSNSIPDVSGGRILKKNKSYYLQCSLPGFTDEIYLCKVNPVNTQFIKDMAEWTIHSVISEAKQQKSIKEVESWTNDTI